VLARIGGVGVGSRPRFYIGDKKKNQAVNTNDIRKAAVLRLTILLATTLTVGRVLVVARAANVAMITNATVSTKKMTSIITRLPDFELRFGKLHIGRSRRPDITDETVRLVGSTPIE